MRRILLTLIFCLQAHASVSQGKLIYSQHCLSCHLEGKYLANTKKAKEWKALLKIKEKSNKLSHLHLKLESAKSSWLYFSHDTYLQDSKHLKDLLQKYSLDRAKHNSCF